MDPFWTGSQPGAAAVVAVDLISAAKAAISSACFGGAEEGLGWRSHNRRRVSSSRHTRTPEGIPAGSPP
ncbi:hypothetical protein KBY93_08705 [Synechococcus sp. J7-Johnson]|uniref:hypothetical protein n=1 Tax=Synechococcus sp. J7-Johnson TaxID=2823737 RepID=UPI0020CCC9C2|nr:hypothetical protein [Synechococcus sp. J7-Johnson]MCP9840715.1 hypothetical protein [Synechococcus sp. J7-Johnson]